jgi:RNA polymerase sigma-70 factor (sigma-E family)
VTQVTEERSAAPDARPADPGDGSFEAYVAARAAALVRFAVVLTGDDHRAEDLVQDVLAKAYLRWDRVLRADPPDVYVRRMIVNAAHSWWRRPMNRELPVERTTDRPDRGDSGGGPEAGIDTRIAERDSMWREIAALPARQRAVLALRYYEDLDDDTIARILNCAPATVRTHAMRALNTLRERYSGERQ